MKITFIQTGGTIDKDYPKRTKGYAFEIFEPALGAVSLIENGIFIAMNGRVFPWDCVVRDPKSGRFINKKQEQKGGNS